MPITDWLTPRPTGVTYRPTNTTKTTHQRHHLDIQDTIHNVHTDAHSTPNTYFQHTIHTIYAQLSNHGITSHTQYTLYNAHAQQSNLGNTRSPVTLIDESNKRFFLLGILALLKLICLTYHGIRKRSCMKSTMWYSRPRVIRPRSVLYVF